MKRLLYIIISILSLSANAQDKALLIGISNYQEGTGWGKIHSHNDIALLQRVLPSSCKVTTLCDSEATYQGIINAINQLIVDTKSGERILFHFSGHGQQMITDDPNEPDLLDEALIPYNAHRKCTSTYRGEYHLVDNQLDSLVSLLRTKAGSNGLVVVSLDACHSGDSNRNIYKDEEKYPRGILEIFGENEISTDKKRVIYAHRKIGDKTPLPNSENMAHAIYLSACMPYRPSFEINKNGIFYGPLTYSISKAYASHSFSSIKEWLHFIEKYMLKEIKQEPYIIDTLD